MALSKDRSGRLHGPILIQQDFDLPAGGEVFLGGLYRVVAGLLARPADDPSQDGCITVYALEHKNNAGGQERAIRARCIVKGLALVPVGDLTAGDVGKSVYPTSDDALALSPTASGNVPAGILLSVDSRRAAVQL